MTSSPKRVAIVIPGFSGGGVERSLLELAEGLISRGLKVDLIVGYDHGDLRSEVPRPANVFPTALGKWRPARKLSLMADPVSFRLLLRDKMAALAPMDGMRRLQSMVEHFKTLQPDGVVAAEATYNVLAVWAKRVARLKSRVVLSEHIQISMHSKLQGPWGNPELYGLLRRAYRRADGIVAVSNGVADDMAHYARLRRNRITTIYNPVVGPKLDAKAKEPVHHPKFAPGQPPVILGAGRLDRQKDFPTLLRAFAEVRATRPASLVILGQGRDPEDTARQRAELMALAEGLGVADHVDLPGFVPNPIAYMARASVFVLSSIYEGLGNVLIEALACGCPVVSTDCPSGPAEILDRGRFGALVPVGDPVALAHAIESTLDDPTPDEFLRARAADFSVQRAVDSYLELLFPEAGAAAERHAA